MNLKAYDACNFNCCIETEGLFKVKGNHVHYKSSNISEIVQDRDVVRLIKATNRKSSECPSDEG